MLVFSNRNFWRGLLTWEINFVLSSKGAKTFLNLWQKDDDKAYVMRSFDSEARDSNLTRAQIWYSGKERCTPTYVFLFLLCRAKSKQEPAVHVSWRFRTEAKQRGESSLQQVYTITSRSTYDDIQDRGIICEYCGQPAAARWTHTRNYQGLSSRMYCHTCVVVQRYTWQILIKKRRR